MKEKTRVRYVGPEKSGVPKGRMGTTLSVDNSGIAMVSWDPYANLECQVTHSGAATTDLEEVTQIPSCGTPTMPGVYVVEYKGKKELAFVRRSGDHLFCHWGISVTRLSKIANESTWWGPVEIC